MRWTTPALGLEVVLWSAAQLVLFTALHLLNPIRNEAAIFLLHVAAFEFSIESCLQRYADLFAGSVRRRGPRKE